jgi:hypothetical protein
MSITALPIIALDWCDCLGEPSTKVQKLLTNQHPGDFVAKDIPVQSTRRM